MNTSPLSDSKHLRFGITGKIWLAISIMLIGYLVTMGQGALTGQYTKNQNSYISNHLFPAALQAQTNLSSFETQMAHFEYAILLGEPERLQTAENYTTIIINGLQTLTTNPNLSEDVQNMGNDLALRYRTFSKQAAPLYAKMTTQHPTEELLRQAAFLAETSQTLKVLFQAMSTQLNLEMDNNLKEINQYFKHQQITSIIIFLATVTISIILVSFILTKTILQPLQKTMHLANLMASGDLSQKVDINQQDEIGALASAMNIMADQIERSHSKMEAIIAKRTRILRQTNEQLRIEVQSKQDAQQEIFNALNQAKQANEAKSTFLANMSHEIRTPMNGIIGMTSLLLATNISDIQTSYLHTLRSSAQSLMNTLNDILDFGKIESGHLHLNIQEFNPLDIVAEITDILTLSLQDRGLEFSTLIDGKIPPLLQGDQVRLRQILLNIIDNAIKFTKTGEIALKLESQNETNQSVTLKYAVSDTGIGIVPEIVNDMFQPFAQADDSTTRTYSGTGLGLAIARKLVELMDGEIHIESDPGMGTTVWFTATFERPQQLNHFSATSQPAELIYSTTFSQSETEQLSQLAGKTILLAEDEPTNQEIMIAILQTYGISPYVVSNGQQALNALELHSFDLILMDCQMPVMDGYDTTKAIRKLGPDGQNIPIIALTADTSIKAQTACLAAGMNDYLTKPVEPKLLKEYILKWLQSDQYMTATPFLIAKLVLKRQGGDTERATQVLIHAEQITQIYLEELQTIKQHNFPEENTDKLCTEVKKLGAHLGIARLQNKAIHLQLALKNKEHKQIEEHAKSLQMSILRLSQELNQAGKDYDSFFNS